jgi:transcriptional regulator with XRE-family HTH domain
MQHNGSTQHGGIRLKQLRVRLGLTVRAVENLSRRLAAEKQNQDFFISRGWLSNVENGTNVPGLFKMYSLGAIYHTHWSSIFSYFGLNLSDFGRDQAMFAPPRTQLVSPSENPDSEAVVVPLPSRGNIKLDKTNLLSRLLEIWGEVPIRMLQHIDTGKCEYGFIGMSDFTMFPILRPGSIVQIDGSQQKISQAKWQNEHDRPIYFVELRGEFICSWCEIRGGNLLAVPSPHSGCAIRQFLYPREAEIVGRVTGVAMRFTEPQP